MSGHHPFSDLTKDFSSERRRRIDGMKLELLYEVQRGGDADTHFPRVGEDGEESTPEG